jgi:hypothetical protein
MIHSAPTEDDFPRSFEIAFAGLQIVVVEAGGAWSEGPDMAPAPIAAALRFAAAEPESVKRLTGEALAHGADGIARHERLISYLSEGLAPGRRRRPEGEHLPAITEDAIASGIVMLVAQRVDRGEGSSLPAAAPEVIQFMLTPYLGVAEARRAGAAHAP